MKMDIWNKVGDKMQTITRMEEDTYIMKNYEFFHHTNFPYPFQVLV